MTNKISIISPEEMKTIEQRRKREYDAEYRESLARRMGYKSYEEYQKILDKKRKERLEGTEKRIKELEIREREEREGEERDRIVKKELETLERKKQIEILETKDKRELCRCVQKISAETKDPESIFKDKEFVRKYTGCNIPLKKNNMMAPKE